MAARTQKSKNETCIMNVIKKKKLEQERYNLDFN